MISAPKGTKDILPSDIYKWQSLEQNIRLITELFNYKEIRTPIFEHTELFLRGVGDATDIVQKEMYTFEDKGGRSITLRPEGTGGVVRALIENGLYSEAQPIKLYYLSAPVFRYERPQAGRLRQHHQFGVEVFGAKEPSIDAEIIELALFVLNKIGIRSLSLNINSIGCNNCRPYYYVALKEYLQNNFDELCNSCKSRFEKNPLRILDCKEEKCRNLLNKAPKIINYLCESCKMHFELLQTYLKALKINFNINPYIVRGLDYYTGTVFEIISESIGAQGTVCGGGRYDKLVEGIGGPQLSGVGFGMGIERLLLILENQRIEIENELSIDVFICAIGAEARIKAAIVVKLLRENGISADMDHVGRSIKAQFKYADKIGVKYVITIGDQELRSDVLKFKNMTTGVESTEIFENVLNLIRG